MNTGNIFNLNDPFEKLVYNRLEEHMRGNDADYVLALMGRDFPFMSAVLKTKSQNRIMPRKTRTGHATGTPDFMMAIL